MKNCIISLVITAFCSIAMCHARDIDYDIRVDNLYYKIKGTDDNAYATLVGYPSTYPPSKMVIPSSITYLERTLPVKVVGNFAFEGTSTLKEVTIPSSIIKIGSSAFNDCKNLESVYIEDLVSWFNMSIASSPLQYAKKLYVNGKLIHDIIVPEGVTSIDSRFAYFKGITSLTCPSSVKTIGNQSFCQCSNLSSVVLGDSVETIGNRAFAECTLLPSIRFPETLTSIGEQAFVTCNGITEITLPPNATTIGDLAFWCPQLTTVTSLSQQPMEIPSKAFHSNTFKLGTLKVPAGKKNRYIMTSGWSQFTTIEELDPVIDINCSDGGYITLNDNDFENEATYMVASGTKLDIQVVPEKGKCIGTLIINGLNRTNELSLDGKLTLKSIREDNSIQATFVDAFSLTMSSNEGGQLLLDKYQESINQIWLPQTSQHTITIKAENGYRLKSFIVNGNNVYDQMTSAKKYQINTLDENMTIQAVFEKIWEVSCEYSAGGHLLINDELANQIIAVDGDQVELAIAVESGYHLQSILANGVDITEKIENGSFKVEGIHSDLYFVASFMKNTYLVTYLVDGDEYKQEKVLFEAKLKSEPYPEKEGYTFSGWSEIPEVMPAYDVTVTGSFTINTYQLSYIVDGEEYKTENVVYATPLTLEPELEKEGYTFSGWSEIPEQMPAHDVTVIGSFTVNSYNLIYNIDGVEYKTIQVAYGTKPAEEAAPEKEGYTFSGWSEIPGQMPAHDVTITGSFTINSYQLTYIVDGEEYKTERIVYSATITPEADLEREGYTFSGWSEIPEQMPSHDVTISGSFTVNSYTVTFMFGDEVLTTESVDYGATIPLPESLNSERYTLLEWLNVPETMPAHDITIYADFTDGMNDIYSKANNTEYYQLNGVKRSKLQHGLNIVKQGNRIVKVMR